MRTLRFLLKKEFLQIVRDRVMLRLIIAVPIVQLVIRSNAATFEVKRARMYLVDLDRTELSRGLVTRLTSSGRFVLRGASQSMDSATEAMLRRRVEIIVRVPRDFESDLIRTRGAPNLEVRARGWYNADLNYRDYMVPGILVLLVTIIGTMLTAMNIVREKEIGTLEQLNVTPVT